MGSLHRYTADFKFSPERTALFSGFGQETGKFVQKLDTNAETRQQTAPRKEGRAEGKNITHRPLSLG
jgi:hypothetical protein